MMLREQSVQHAHAQQATWVLRAGEVRDVRRKARCKYDAVRDREDAL